MYKFIVLDLGLTFKGTQIIHYLYFFIGDPKKNILVFRYFSCKFQKKNLSLHHETKILMMTTTNTATLDESKLVVRDMTPEELYAVIEQDIKAIYEADDVI